MFSLLLLSLFLLTPAPVPDPACSLDPIPAPDLAPVSSFDPTP